MLLSDRPRKETCSKQPLYASSSGAAPAPDPVRSFVRSLGIKGPEGVRPSVCSKRANSPRRALHSCRRRRRRLQSVSNRQSSSTQHTHTRGAGWRECKKPRSTRSEIATTTLICGTDDGDGLMCESERREEQHLRVENRGQGQVTSSEKERETPRSIHQG